MLNIIQSPSKYIQGHGSINAIADYAKHKSLVIADDFVMKLVQSDVEMSFKKQSLDVQFETFRGECSKVEIDRLKEILNTQNCEVVIGIGGGKTLDTAKAIGFYAKIPVIICPTIASTDAPCSALSVLYTEDGIFDEYLLLPRNPDIVLVDTAIVTQAPVRLLASGMGDALSTYFEARACARSNAVTMAGGHPTKASMALATLCYHTLLEDGIKAYFAVQKKVCTQAVENIIEANTYLSGIGFESGGLAAAHAIHNGFTALEECHHLYHGEKVTFGTIVQLFLENAESEEIDVVIDFAKALGLPTNLREMGIIEVDKEKIMTAAKLACAPNETIHNMPFKVTPEKVYAAIIAADAYVTSH